MGFSDDQILIENLYVSKGYRATKIIMKFLNKSWGLRELNKLLKKLQEAGIMERQSKPLAAVINTSFSQGVFPDTLKSAKVSPNIKSRDKLLINNYRPPSFSIISVFKNL